MEVDDDLGKTGAELGLWRAREAVRQTEGQLKVQGDWMSGMETRAGAILGWCAAAASAVGLGIATGNVAPVYGLVGVPLGIAWLAAIRIVFPKPWANVGIGLSAISSWAEQHGVTSELEHVEGHAAAMEAAAARNAGRLARAARCLKVAWYALAGMPVAVALISIWARAASL